VLQCGTACPEHAIVPTWKKPMTTRNAVGNRLQILVSSNGTSRLIQQHSNPTLFLRLLFYLQWGRLEALLVLGDPRFNYLSKASNTD
jgi:hypothetical protein